MKIKKFNEKNIVIIIGSARSKNNCPSQNGKTFDIVIEAIKDLPKNINVEILDLSVEDDKPMVQPCKGCISTAGGAHCHWECDCFVKNDKDHPDYMHDFDVYKKLKDCDAFIVFTPINWWSVPTEVKAFFDRLTCASLTMTTKQAKKQFGDDVKNPKLTKPFSETDEFKKMIKNHLEGKTGAFFVHGDDGADDYINRKIPKSMKDYETTKCSEPFNAILPIVNQCRYMGINVPEELILAFIMNDGISYSEANDEPLTTGIKKAKKLINDTIKYL